ncbi:Type I restriction-modification system, specificity subunit S [Heyndrickxia sporothermodurans]|uniref:Type I restriction-modification system, specificity subunit S n=1 Tax=Heyndrickxia sporothermodurans TaxID=46224 RepID=A0A150L6R9_9BACI|nr:restriction endonuclease subunit S [Heyndrickxia sporothermodurans]KYD07960.1 Type I restriction-modification system, specificity subunit S [Heyndrickxia sporothermodurans]
MAIKTIKEYYPLDWTESSFKDLFEFEGGLSISRANLSDEGICYLHYGDIHKSTESFVNVERDYNLIPKYDTTLEEVKEKYLLREGDIVFADASEDYAGIGKSVVVINPQELPFISGLHTIVAKDKTNKLDNGYKRFFLTDWNIRKQLMVMATGISVYGLSKTNLEKIRVVLPPKEEQQKIASILSTWDKAIELKEKLIEQKKEQKKGLMQKLLTGEVRLPGFAGRWQQVRLGNLTKLQGGYAFKSAEFVQQGIPIIRISNIDPEIIETNQDFVYYDEIGISDSFKVNFGDILIAMSGATTGKVGLYKKREIAYLNQRVGKFVNLDKSKLDYSFLYHLIMSSMFKLQLKEELATGAQPNISSRQIENFKFKIPSLDEQKKISKTLNQIDRSINLQEKEIVYLKQQKQGLMQLLLTGKVRVKV